MRAAANGRSMEAEARDILLSALDRPSRPDLTWIEMLIQAARAYDPVHGVELEIPSRRSTRPVEIFGDQ